MCREGAWAELTVCVPSMGELSKGGARTLNLELWETADGGLFFVLGEGVWDCCKAEAPSMYGNIARL